MLQLPKLSHENPYEIIQAALQHIDHHQDVWQTRGVHDPGITVLELLAHIKAEQEAHIDKIGLKSLQQMMGLLGMDKVYPQGAKTFVAFESQTQAIIPRGTPCMAFDMVFETVERLEVLDNTIQALGTHDMGGSLRFQAFHGAGGQRKVWLFEEGGMPQKCFYITFANRLPEQTSINLFIELWEDAGSRRNPVTDPESFVPLSVLNWEYYGHEDGVLGWHPVEILQDETYGLLFSGRLTFALKGSQEACAQEDFPWLLRARLVKDGYDRLPVLKSLHLNVAALVQQETHIETIRFSASQAIADNLLFDAYLAMDGCFDLLIRSGEGYRTAAEMGVAFTVQQTSNHMFRLVLQGETRQWLEDIEGDEALLLIIYSQKAFHSQKVLGSGNGIASHIYKVPGVAEDEAIAYAHFQLFVKDKAGMFYPWQKAEALEPCGPKDKVYFLNPDKGALQFGNNIHGKVPTRGKDNLWVTALQTVKGKKGNMVQGLINRFCEAERFPGITMHHFQEAAGGRDSETPEDMLNRALRLKDSLSQKAVTVADYANFAYQTQGVLIDNVSVVPLYNPNQKSYGPQGAENTITVVVDGKNIRSSAKAAFLENYIENVRRQLNRVKLVTTRIHVLLPVEVPMDIDVEAAITAPRQQVLADMQLAVAQYINDIQHKGFGGTFYHSRIFAAIECLYDVQKVKYLKLSIPKDKGEMNRFGDVTVPPYAKVFIRELTLTDV